MVDGFGGLIVPEQQDRDRFVQLIFKVGVALRTGLHWHETHTGKYQAHSVCAWRQRLSLRQEYLQVLQGHAAITIGDQTAVFGPEDGVITIPKFTVHQYGRADDTPEGSHSREIDLVVKEWTDPADGKKELFFRNVIGTIIDREPGLVGGIAVLLSMFTIFWYHDNYPVFWAGPWLLGKSLQIAVMKRVTYTVLAVAATAGRLLGCRADYDEYSPAHLSHLRS